MKKRHQSLMWLNGVCISLGIFVWSCGGGGGDSNPPPGTEETSAGQGVVDKNDTNASGGKGAKNDNSPSAVAGSTNASTGGTTGFISVIAGNNGNPGASGNAGTGNPTPAGGDSGSAGETGIDNSMVCDSFSGTYPVQACKDFTHLQSVCPVGAAMQMPAPQSPGEKWSCQFGLELYTIRVDPFSTCPATSKDLTAICDCGVRAVNLANVDAPQTVDPCTDLQNMVERGNN